MLCLGSSAGAQAGFGSVNLGSSVMQAVTVTLPSGDVLSSVAVVTRGATGLDYTDAGGGTCVSGVASGASCTVKVSFTPKRAGPRSGAIVVTDATGVVATVPLSGIGSGPQFVFGESRTPLSIPAKLIGAADAVAEDGAGNIYVGDSGYTDVESSSPLGRVLKETPAAGGKYTQTVIATGFYGPQWIGVDGAGNVYIHDSGKGESNDIVYKETLVGGSYRQSVAVTIPSSPGLGGPAISTSAVDASGNVYYLAPGFSGTVGTAAGVFVATLQPDGSYVQSGPLPSPDTVSASGTTCSPVRTDSVAVDGTGTVYFNGWSECSAAYTSSSDYFVYAYSAGTAQAPKVLIGTSIKAVAPIYLPIETNMVAGNAGELYFWNFYNTQSFLEYVPTPTGYAPAPVGINLGTVVPWGGGVDEDGGILLADAGSGFGKVTDGGVYKLDYAGAPTINFQATAKGVLGADSPKFVYLANIGSAPLSFSQISFPPDFPQDTTSTQIYNPCSTTAAVASQGACTLYVDFLPLNASTTGLDELLTENISFASNLLSSPTNITVAGTVSGLPAAAMPTFSPAAGAYTSVQTVTISDISPGATIYYTLDGTTPTAGSSKYTGAIAVAATETIQAFAGGAAYYPSPVASAAYTITLPPDFVFAVTPASLTVASGGSGTVTGNLSPANGQVFTSAVTFACSGLPGGSTCSFSPSSVVPTGIGSSVAITISVPTSVGLLQPEVRDHAGAGGGPMLAVVLFGAAMLARRRIRIQLLPMIAICAAICLTGCGSGGNAGGGGTKQPVKAVVTVTASAGTVQHAATVALTVP